MGKNSCAGRFLPISSQSVRKTSSPSGYDENTIHQACPRCRLILVEDLCVCGWRRPQPPRTPKQTDWIIKPLAVLLVGVALWWLTRKLLPVDWSAF